MTSGKLTGLMACAALILCAVFLSWSAAGRDFRHQHLSDAEPPETAAIAENDPTGKIIPLDGSDCLLNEYLFRNLAGELLPFAPETFYTEENGKLFQYQQSQRECARPVCEYAVQVRHRDSPDAPAGLAADKEIITFVDYTYADVIGRQNRIVLRGGRTDEAIRREISRFEKSLYSYDYDSRLYGYKPQLNALCFVDYFLLYELAYPGNCRENTALLCFDRDGKFDICTGAFPGSGRYNGEAEYHNLISSPWFAMLLKSRAFTGDVIREYRYQREHFFSEEYLFRYVEELCAFLAQYATVDAEALNCQKEQLCAYLQQRLAWLDDNIDSLREFSALSAVKHERNTPY